MKRNSPTIDIHLLGTFDIRLAGNALKFPYEKPKLLCAYLITEGGPLSRSHLAERLWPDRSTHHARQNLRQAIATLKRLFGTTFDELFTLTRHSVEFIGHGRCTVDIELLKDTAQTSSNSVIAAWQSPISYFYPGPFCQGMNIGDCQEFDEWLQARRLEFQSLAITLSRKLLNAGNIAGD